MAKFFKYGLVKVLHTDEIKRQAAVQVCVPCCVMQACLPILLGFGLMDGLAVRNPVAAWAPIPTSDLYKPEVVTQSPHAPEAIGKTVEAKIGEALSLYAEISRLVISPQTMAYILPMGTYVTFRYRCGIDDVAKIIMGLQAIPSPGVPEFQYAMAQELASTLEELGDVIDEASRLK